MGLTGDILFATLGIYFLGFIVFAAVIISFFTLETADPNGQLRITLVCSAIYESP